MDLHYELEDLFLGVEILEHAVTQASASEHVTHGGCGQQNALTTLYNLFVPFLGAQASTARSTTWS